MPIRIIADSASDIPQGGRPELSILPLSITFGEDEYLDGVNLRHREFYEKLIESSELPTTSQIPPYAFERALAEAKARGETPLILTLSSKLSGTYQSARIALAQFDGEAYLVDSQTVCVGERILVEYALRLADQGLGAQAIAQRLEEEKGRVKVVALLDTLEYLRRGGRIPKSAALVGSVFSIKPVIAIDRGEVVILGKARGSRNGNNLLNEQIRLAGGVDFAMPYALGYTGLSDALLQKYIGDNEGLWRAHTQSLPIGTVGGSIGTHAGPGAVAVGFFAQKD